MHPTVMTIIAEDRATDLRSQAVARRRGRQARVSTRRLFAFRRPRRAARIAHV